MTNEQASPRPESAGITQGPVESSRGPIPLAVGGLGWSLLLVVAIWTLPLVTVNTGRAGFQPRETLAASGEPFGITLFATAAAFAVAITALVVASVTVTSHRRALATTALALAILLAGLAVVATVTTLTGLLVLPEAALLVAATALARQR